MSVVAVDCSGGKELCKATAKVLKTALTAFVERSAVGQVFSPEGSCLCGEIEGSANCFILTADNPTSQNYTFCPSRINVYELTSADVRVPSTITV